jgi:hypothetical protein
MKACILTGSKQEIADKVSAIDGEVREAIVFVEEPILPSESAADMSAEMEPFTVRRAGVEDSRDAIYQRLEDE